MRKHAVSNEIILLLWERQKNYRLFPDLQSEKALVRIRSDPIQEWKLQSNFGLRVLETSLKMLFFTFLNCFQIIFPNGRHLSWLLDSEPRICRHRQLSLQNGQQRVISSVVDPWKCGTDLGPAIFVLDLQDAKKYFYLSFSAYTFFAGTFISFF